jgi:glycosyltransferase involved in cell wall biosynthesis
MTMKICHLISGDLWAGAEVMVCNLLKGLKKLPDVDPFAILFNRGKLSEELETAGIPIYVIDEKKRSFPVIVKLAATIVREQVPQVIHSHGYKENILSYFISLTVRKNVVLISTQHGLPENYSTRSTLKKRLKSIVNFGMLAKKFDKVVAVSFDVKGSLIKEYGVPDKHIEVIHNGIIIAETPRAPRKKDVFVIGSAGRLFPVKDYPFMIDIAMEVNRKNKKIRFEIAGEGPMFEQIQASIKKNKLEKQFKLRGFVRDMSNFYKKLDIYLITSIHEGIPMSVLEAMSYGIPILASNVGGLSEIITAGREGYLLDDRDPKLFAEKCFYLYENEGARKRMADSARGKIKRKFLNDYMIEKYANIYQKHLYQKM